MGDRSAPMCSCCECAATYPVVPSIAVRVAPDPTWSSPEPAWQSAGPEESATTYEYEEYEVVEDNDAQDASSTAADGDQSVSTAISAVPAPCHVNRFYAPARARGKSYGR